MNLAPSDVDEELGNLLNAMLAQKEFPDEYVPTVSLEEIDRRKKAIPTTAMRTVQDEQESPDATGRMVSRVVEYQEPIPGAPLAYEVLDDPDLITLPPDGGAPNADFLFGLQLSYVNLNTKLRPARGSLPTLRDITESIFPRVKNSSSFTDGPYVFRVHYLSVADERRLAGHHDRRQKGTQREYEDVEKARERRETPEKGLTRDQVETLLFGMFENQAVVRLEDVRKLVRTRKLRIRRGMLVEVLRDIAVRMDASGPVSYRLKPEYDVGVRTEPAPLDVPKPDETFDDMLLWIDFDEKKMKKQNAIDVRTFNQNAHSMFVRASGKRDEEPFELSFHVFSNGSVRLSVGFREGRYKNLDIATLDRGEAETLGRDAIRWFTRTFAENATYDENAIDIVSISMTGGLTAPLYLSFVELQDEQAGRRERLQGQIEIALRYTHAGMNPVAKLVSTMPRGIDDPDDDPIDPSRVYEVMEEGPEKKRTKFAYVKQHMNRWKIEVNPHMGLEDVATFDAFERTTFNYFKAIGVQLKREADVRPERMALWRELRSSAVLRPDFAHPLLTMRKLANGNWVFRSFSDPAQPSTFDKDLELPEHYFSNVFAKPVPVLYWWSTGRLTMHASSDIYQKPWEALKTSWIMLDKVMRRDGPGNHPPIVAIDEEPAQRKERKRGHERYALPKERPGRTKGTTCKPANRIPNPADPYDFEAECREGGIVMPDAQGFPCCFKPLDTQAFRDKIKKAYRKFRVPMPQRVMAFLDITSFDHEADDDEPAAAAVLDFDKLGRLRINKRLATRHHVKTIVEAATEAGIPTQESRRQQKSTPTLIQELTWHFLVQGGGVPGGKPLGYYQTIVAALPKELQEGISPDQQGIASVLPRLADVLEEVKSGPSDVSTITGEDRVVSPTRLVPAPEVVPRRLVFQPEEAAGPSQPRRRGEVAIDQRKEFEEMRRRYEEQRMEEDLEYALLGQELQARYERERQQRNRNAKRVKASMALEREEF